MHELIYHDMLDTVRTPDSKRDATEFAARRFAAANLMLSVVLGDTPVLSQTQAFDSSALLGTLQNSADSLAFLSLIRRGFVRVKLFNKPDLTSAFLGAIENDNFIFSGWPEVRNKEIDRAAIKARIVEGATTDLPEAVLSRLASLQDLSAAISEAASNDQAVSSAISLKELIHKAASVVPLEYQHNVVKLDQLQSNDRSVHYATIDMMAISRYDRDMLRSLVDMLYNKVVASSLGATHVTLTGTQPEAVTFVRGLLTEELRAREPFSAEEVGSLNRLGWSDIEQFATKYEKYSCSDRIREGFEAKFLARVHQPTLGVAILPKFAGLLFTGSVGAAAALVGVLYPEAMPVVAAGAFGSVFGAINTAKKVEELTLKKVELRYAGILERKRL